MRRYIMALAVGLSLAACGGDDPADPDDNDNDNLPNGSVTGSIAGGGFAPIAAGFSGGPPGNSVGFSITDNQARIISVAVSASTPGTYSVTTVGNFAAWVVGSQSWRADFQQGSGTVSFDILTANRIKGELVLTMTPLAGSGATGVVTASLSFDISKTS